MVLDRSSVSRPSSLQSSDSPRVPSDDAQDSIGRGGVRQVVVAGSTAPGTSGTPGIGVLMQGGATVCSGRVDVREANLLHGIQMIEIAPELLEAVRCRKRLRVVTQMVLAELPCVVAEVEQELGKRRCTLSQPGGTARQLRYGHPGTQRCQAREERIAAGGAAGPA